MASIKRTVVILLASSFLAGCRVTADAVDDGRPDRDVLDGGQSTESMDNQRIILDFILAWSRLDPAELASFFTEDGVYHNMPSEPVQGRANVEALIRGFSANWSASTWDVVTIMSSGDVVIAERVDRIRAGDKSVDLPVVGVFELESGKIKAWRDYFDLGTYARAMN